VSRAVTEKQFKKTSIRLEQKKSQNIRRVRKGSIMVSVWY